jgi:hypothetical protein
MSSKDNRRFRPRLEGLESRLAPALGVTASFNGLGNTGWTPPDPSLAAGPNYVVETVNESMAIFNKATGALVSQETLQNLFSGFATGTVNDAGMFDSSVLFDDQAGRFVIEAQVRDSTNQKAYVDIAVSSSSDPTQGFAQKYQIEVDEGAQYWSDNGKLGFNADAYVFTGNLYTFAGAGGGELVLTVNKSALLNNNTLTDYLVNFNNNGTYPYGFSMIPARMHGSTAGGPMWFVETYFGGGSLALVTRMDNVLSPAPTFTTFSVPVASYGVSTSGLQPGGSIDTGDSRTLNVEWNNNYLAAAFDSAVGTDPAAAWLEFNTAGASPSVAQQGAIHPGTGVSTYMPAVAVDANGDLGLTYMQSSATEYASIYVTGRLASDPAGTLQAPVRVAAGTTTGTSRVGDYSGISLDPSSANTFWAGSEYDTSDGGGNAVWATWLTAFKLATGGDQPPTIAAPASASPGAVTGTMSNLSVLGADDSGETSLTYSWSLKNGPAGAPAPIFSANGTNAAKNTTTTFSQAGSYTFQVTITDPAGLTTTSNVTVTVSQTLTSLSLTPPTSSLVDGGAEQLTAAALDQFGNALVSQPSFSWSLAGIGSLSSAGMYSAPSSGTGSATVTVSNGAKSAAASVSVAASPPSIVTPASASPGPVTGTTYNLNVQGTDAAGASTLTYTWSTTTAPAGASSPVFSANGSNAAQNTMATLYEAGTYTFKATLTDPAGLTASSSITVVVNQTLTSINVAPGTATLPDTGTQGFIATALDQFGASLASQPTFSWTVLSGIGAISSGGTYTAPTSGTGSAMVAAISGAISGTASVTVTALAVPAMPTNLTAAAVSKSQVNLSWTESSSAIGGFNIQRSSNGGKSWTQIGTVGANATTYADTTVSKGKTYKYRVDAYNGAGASPWSAAVTVTTPLQTPGLLPDPDVPAFVPLPAAPSDLTAWAASPHEVDLSWATNSTGASGFIIQRLGPDGNWTTIALVDGGVTTFSDTKVNPTETYQYRVFAQNDAGNSPFSNVTQPVLPLASRWAVMKKLASQTFNEIPGDWANQEFFLSIEQPGDLSTRSSP